MAVGLIVTLKPAGDRVGEESRKRGEEAGWEEREDVEV